MKVRIVRIIPTPNVWYKPTDYQHIRQLFILKSSKKHKNLLNRFRIFCRQRYDIISNPPNKNAKKRKKYLFCHVISTKLPLPPVISTKRSAWRVPLPCHVERSRDISSRRSWDLSTLVEMTVLAWDVLDKPSGKAERSTSLEMTRWGARHDIGLTKVKTGCQNREATGGGCLYRRGWPYR